MKKTAIYVGLILLAGMLAGALVCGLVWMQFLYELSLPYYLFTVLFWLGMLATLLFGMWLRKYFATISRAWVLFSMFAALMSCYLFPQFFTPQCSEIPLVKAGCTTTCTGVCTWWVPPEHTRCMLPPDSPHEGCCLAYGTECVEECTYYPPSVSGYTTCSTFGNDGWCVTNGQLHMSGTDPDGDTITFSGTMVGQAFSCAPGNSCLKTLIEGNGNAIFHGYDGRLSSGNFSLAYKFDATAPTLMPDVVGTAGSNGWYITTVNVSTGATDAVSGVASSQIRLLSDTWQDSLSLVNEGVTTVEMSALDVAGNEATQQAQIMIDTVPPVQEIGIFSGKLGKAGYYVGDVSINAISGDATSGVASVAYRVDTGVWQTGTSVTISDDGTHTVEFVTTDNAGLTDRDSIPFKLDKTKPQITITPTGITGLNGWYISPVGVDMSATDATSGVAVLKYSLDGAAIAAWSSPLLLTDGEHIVDAYAEDAAGNTMEERLILSIDTLPPVPDVQATGMAGINDWYRSDVTWQATATDATSRVASIEVSADAAPWMLDSTALFTTEGVHTVDFRYTDNAGNQTATHNAFSIDKTNPLINVASPLEGAIVKQNVFISGTAADPLSGVAELEISINGGATWQPLTWAADGSWSYDWDTTDGPNGVFALIARDVDEAGNISTQQVSVIVDNAPPSVSITELWWIWNTAAATVYENIIPLGSISITVECGDLSDRVVEYNPNRGPFDFKWDRRCGDGDLAESGKYTVVLQACDIYHNCARARGKVEIPFVALVPPTATPMPTLAPVSEVVWYDTPTPVSSATPTPKQELVLPILPATGGGDGSEPTPSEPNQPLLSLAATALGASVLLAANSRREEREAQAAADLAALQVASAIQQAADLAAREASVAAQTVATVNVEAPEVEVSTLAALAGVVKEAFSGIWSEAERISPADAPITIVRHYGLDMDEYNRKLAGWIAQIEFEQTPEYKRLVEASNNQQRKAGKVDAQPVKVDTQDCAEYMRLIASTGGKAITDLSDEQFDDFVSQSPGAAKAAYMYYESQKVAYEAAQKKASEYSNQVKAFHEGEAASNTSYEEYNSYHDKLTRMEEATVDKNVINQSTLPTSQLNGIKNWISNNLIAPFKDIPSNTVQSVKKFMNSTGEILKKTGSLLSDTTQDISKKVSTAAVDGLVEAKNGAMLLAATEINEDIDSLGKMHDGLTSVGDWVVDKYMGIWKNFNSASTIAFNKNATFWQKVLARNYMSGVVAIHLALALGVGLLTWELAGYAYGSVNTTIATTTIRAIPTISKISSMPFIAKVLSNPDALNKIGQAWDIVDGTMAAFAVKHGDAAAGAELQASIQMDGAVSAGEVVATTKYVSRSAAGVTTDALKEINEIYVKYDDDLAKIIIDFRSGKFADELSDEAKEILEGLSGLSKYIKYADDGADLLKYSDDIVEFNKYIDAHDGNKFEIVNTQTAEELNKFYNETKNYLPISLPNTKAYTAKLTEETNFVRVYTDDGTHGLYGGFIMLEDDLVGLTAQEIQEKFALDFTPKFVADVKFKAGDMVRFSVTNKNYGFNGGAIQIDLMNQRIGEFEFKCLIEELLEK